MLNQAFRKKFLLGGTVIAGFAACTVSFAPAYAQTAAEQEAEVDAAVEDDTEVEAVVVTGSRIRRTDLTASAPIQIITSATIDEKGFTNVGDALNELPTSGVPVNPVGDQSGFSVGRSFVNIFNLGSNRTLTLVNGRRFVGAQAASLFVSGGSGGQVDLNIIPTGIIDRIETIQATGGAVYGTDAVAGVINIITKDSFDGFEVDVQYGLAEEGDAQDYRVRFLGGRSFLNDRFNVAGSYEYNESEALALSDRERGRQNLAFALNPENRTTTDGIPGAILIFDRRVPETNLGGLPFRTGGAALSGLLTVADPSNPANRVPAQFAPDGTLVPYQTGTFFQSGVASGGGGLNLATLGSLISPVKRHVATAFANFDLTDNLRLEGEFFYGNVMSTEPFNQPIFNAPLFGGNSASLRFSTANPFLTAQARAALLSQATPLPADTTVAGERIFFLSRSSVDIGNNQTTAEGDTYRGVLNLAGDFDVLGREIFFNVAGNYGISDGTFSSPNIVQTRFVDAVDAVRDASGQIVCRSATARAEGCAPLNLFGFGAPSRAALDYVGVAFRSEFEIKQTTYEANLGGDLFNVPAGAVSFNVGFEYRKEESSFMPNDPQRNGVGRSAAIAGLQGEYDTKEYYAEGLLPIFGDDFGTFGLRRLEIDGAYRAIDNSLAGEDEAWSVGVRYYPIDDLLLRGSKSRSFRAPAITELFLPTSTSFITATDPCDARNIGGGPSPAARRRNCEAALTALGLPAGFQLTSNVQTATVRGTTAGNTSLQNEIAEQWTAGLVYQPSFAPGLAITADWTNIDLTSAIFNFNLTAILQVCYDSPTPPADACGRFVRGNAASGPQFQGQILSADNEGSNGGPRTGFINAGYRYFQGLTFGIDYDLELERITELSGLFNGDPGRLGFNFDLFHVNRIETSVTGLGFDLNDDKNEVGFADLEWKLETSYARDPFSILVTTRYTGESIFDNTFTPETRNILKVEDYYIHDASLVVDLASAFGGRFGLRELDARFVVRNIGDVQPPFGVSGGLATAIYDLVGRFYQVGLKARF